jgi:hypothetical protein
MTGVPRSEWGNQAQWALTACLLAASLGGVSGTLAAALGLCAVSTVHYLARLRSVRAYRVQIRLGFMAVAALAFVPGLEKILWIPLFGTTAQVLFGYCPMARFLDLMPWNRRVPLTWGFLVGVVTRPPGGEGLLLRGRSAPSPAPSAG